MDLDLPFGATPAILQLLKALYEVGCEVIVTPYRGNYVRSLWWRGYDNPCKVEGELYSFFQQNKKFKKKDFYKQKEGLTPKIARLVTLPKWRNHLKKILDYEKDIEALLFIQIPLNQIKGLGSYIKDEFGIPVLYYEVDVPTSLPKYGGFTFNHFIGSDLSEYDAIIIPSEGSRKSLLEMGAQKVFILHFGVDPEIYSPIDTEFKYDVCFSGYGSRNREKSINSLITVPSIELDAKFVVSGQGYNLDLGNAISVPSVPFNSWRTFCSASKINLNIPRENHALTYATSTSRPFELAALKCCIVSSKYLGLEKWFDLKKELLVAENSDEAKELYLWLLSNEDDRLELANNAYQRVIRDHTFKHRAKKMIKYFQQIK